MKRSVIMVAWRQLTHQKMKLIAAVAGVVVAVMLMLVQLGIRQGVLDNTIAFVRLIDADLVIVSPSTNTIFNSAQFPRRLMWRMKNHAAVEDVQEVYRAAAMWRNPWNHIEHPIGIYGLDADEPMLNLPGLEEQAGNIRLMDRILFDGMSRDTYGPVVAELEKGEVVAELNSRKVHVVGHIDVGIAIANDGNVYTTRENFLRVFPQRPAGSIDLGLIRLQGGADVQQVLKEVRPLLGEEAKILTQPDLVASEISFVRTNAPIDFIFGMGAVVGFFIGGVVVYQILYTEVTNHLPQFATLKAMGFTDGYLLRLVLSEAVLLSLFGYLPGFFMALGLYRVATDEIQMPFTMTAARAIGVFIATLVMCCISAAIAIRKAQTANPADVF